MRMRCLLVKLQDGSGVDRRGWQLDVFKNRSLNLQLFTKMKNKPKTNASAPPSNAHETPLYMAISAESPQFMAATQVICAARTCSQHVKSGGANVVSHYTYEHLRTGHRISICARCHAKKHIRDLYSQSPWALREEVRVARWTEVDRTED